jgi:hypothetical protein
VGRHQAIEAIRFLNRPMLRVQVQRLRQAYRDFQNNGSIQTLLEAIEEQWKAVGITQVATESPDKTSRITREDLKLICFDILS